MQYEDEEIWKDVVGYEGLYEVSSHGRVRSLPRVYQSPEDGFNWTKSVEFKEKALRVKSSGYVDTSLHKNGEALQKSVHRLVAQAFIPNPENKRCVNHIDNNPTNNHVSNLEWVTYKENAQHRDNQMRGAFQRQWGENNVSAKLTLKTVLEIRKLKLAGNKNRFIADELGVNIKEVGRILRKERWNFPEAFPEYYEAL